MIIDLVHGVQHGNRTVHQHVGGIGTRKGNVAVGALVAAGAMNDLGGNVAARAAHQLHHNRVGEGGECLVSH